MSAGAPAPGEGCPERNAEVNAVLEMLAAKGPWDFSDPGDIASRLPAWAEVEDVFADTVSMFLIAGQGVGIDPWETCARALRFLQDMEEMDEEWLAGGLEEGPMPDDRADPAT